MTENFKIKVKVVEVIFLLRVIELSRHNHSAVNSKPAHTKLQLQQLHEAKIKSNLMLRLSF